MPSADAIQINMIRLLANLKLHVASLLLNLSRHLVPRNMTQN